MFSATTKSITSSLLLLALAACGGSADDAAAELYDRANRLYEAGNPAVAIELLDSIDSMYVSQTEIRRKGMHLRAVAMEKLTVARLAQTDSLIAALTLENQNLSGRLSRVENAVEPYYIASGSTLPPTGLQARMSPDGVVYIISSVSGHQVRHTSVTASNSTGSASTAVVPNDGERSVWNPSNETVHFVGAECDSLIHFIASSAQPVTVSWNGTSVYSRPLTVSEQDAITTVSRYADSAMRLKVAAYEHEKLERQLEIARSQAARTFIDKSAESDSDK